MTATAAQSWGIEARGESLGGNFINITTTCYLGPSWVGTKAINGLQASLSWAGLYHFYVQVNFETADIAPEHATEAIAETSIQHLSLTCSLRV